MMLSVEQKEPNKDLTNKPRKWWISGLLSFIRPGLGQIYNGQALKGVIYFLCYLSFPFLLIKILTFYPASHSILVICFLFFIPLVFFVLVIADAIYQSNKLRHEYILKRYNNPIVYIGIFLALVAMSELIPNLEFDKEKITSNYIQAYKIASVSMEPTLLPGDHILVDRRLAARNPARGALSVFVYPKDETKDFVKRVVALGGDIVEIRNKYLYVNNKLVKESQVIHKDKEVLPASQSPRDNFGPITVPTDSFFVMGDNRELALDSRFWGVVDKDKMKGTVTQIYWSWDRITSTVRWNRIGKNVL